MTANLISPPYGKTNTSIHLITSILYILIKYIIYIITIILNKNYNLINGN